MTLAEAISTVATAGCRLVPDHAGGVALVVPDGATLPREVLDVLRAHREQLAAAHAPRRPERSRDELAAYLREKGLHEPAVELVVHAAEVFDVPGQNIVHELADEGPDDGREPALFEPGIPILTTIDTEWHAPGRGYFTIPAGTLGLAMPQRWAIADDHARDTIERVIDEAKRRGKPLHVAVWLAGEPRALDLDAFTFEGAVAPPGMDLLPWRPRPGGAAA